MPPLLLLAAIGAGAYLGIKWANSGKGVKKKHTPTPSQAKEAPNKAKNLKKDPVTGVYSVED